MAYKFDSRSAESYKNQLKKIKEEIAEIIDSMENNQDDIVEIDNDHNTYKTEGYNNSIQLKRKSHKHNSRSANVHQLDGNTETVRTTPE